MQSFYVYIMAGRTRTIYVGVTNDIDRRVMEHKSKKFPGFTRKYNITKLVWFEEMDSSREAIEFEKRLKGWKREKKVALIESMNPDWRDFADEREDIEHLKYLNKHLG